MLIRNFFYSAGIFQSQSYPFPVIGVGNLSTGGTGKSPMVEYLLDLLQKESATATLSRGYGRKTTGFILLKGDETPAEVGDEPLQFKYKFPNTAVAVDENRKRGIDLLRTQNSPDVIILDDVFQHRMVTPGLNILLSSYDSLYINDLMLPTGNLREPRAGAGRADVVVITKGPENISEQEQNRIRKSLKLKDHQNLFFSYIGYSKIISNNHSNIRIQDLVGKEVILVTGIANPKPLCDFLEKQGIHFKHWQFPDHHLFSPKELKEIANAPLVLTTEKDFMRLRHLGHRNLFYISIKMEFVNDSTRFDSVVKDFVYNEK